MSAARGQPLVVLLALLAGWTAARAMSVGGDHSRSVAAGPQPSELAGAASGGAVPVYGAQSYPAGYYPAWPQDVPAARARTGPPGGALHVAPATPRPPAYGYPPAHRPEAAAWRFFDIGPAPSAPAAPPRRPSDEWLASLSVRSTVAGGEAQSGQVQSTPARRRPSRWSADTWTMLRGRGAGPVSEGLLPASYGASQAGGIMRYRLAPMRRLDPTIYLRATSALGATFENTAALGISAQPLAGVPVDVAVEGRVIDRGNGREVVPAALIVAGPPPLALPMRLRAEAYGQGGYVGGSNVTAFADGFVRVDRRLLALGRLDARLGGGLWGGVQRGAARFDAGPGLTVSAPLGRNVYGRMSLDWRFRVAGDAEPGSGPALTVSAGF